MKNRKIIKKGDIYNCEFKKDESDARTGTQPVLILQANNYNIKSPMTIVADITSANKEPSISSHISLGKNFGLLIPSMVMMEQIKTVNKNNIGEYIGHIDDKLIWKQINSSLKDIFGLRINYNSKNSNIRCLCPKCLKDYFDTNFYIIRRVDPYKHEKEKCEKCNGYGYDYYVTDKRISIGVK